MAHVAGSNSSSGCRVSPSQGTQVSCVACVCVDATAARLWWQSNQVGHGCKLPCCLSDYLFVALCNSTALRHSPRQYLQQAGTTSCRTDAVGTRRQAREQTEQHQPTQEVFALTTYATST